MADQSQKERNASLSRQSSNRDRNGVNDATNAGRQLTGTTTQAGATKTLSDAGKKNQSSNTSDRAKLEAQAKNAPIQDHSLSATDALSAIPVAGVAANLAKGAKVAQGVETASKTSAVGDALNNVASKVLNSPVGKKVSESVVNTAKKADDAPDYLYSAQKVGDKALQVGKDKAGQVLSTVEQGAKDLGSKAGSTLSKVGGELSEGASKVGGKVAGAAKGIARENALPVAMGAAESVTRTLGNYAGEKQAQKIINESPSAMGDYAAAFSSGGSGSKINPAQAEAHLTSNMANLAANTINETSRNLFNMRGGYSGQGANNAGSVGGTVSDVAKTKPAKSPAASVGGSKDYYAVPGANRTDIGVETAQRQTNMENSLSMPKQQNGYTNGGSRSGGGLDNFDQDKVSQQARDVNQRLRSGNLFE